LKKDFIYIAAQFLLFAIYFIDYTQPLYSINYLVSIVLWILVFIGAIIIILGIVNLNDNLTIFPKPKNDSDLISHGIYKYVRHPIYTGILLVMISYGLQTGSPIKWLVTCVLAIIFYFKSSLEEKYLLTRHEVYSTYQKKTGRFLPKWNRKS